MDVLIVQNGIVPVIVEPTVISSSSVSQSSNSIVRFARISYDTERSWREFTDKTFHEQLFTSQICVYAVDFVDAVAVAFVSANRLVVSGLGQLAAVNLFDRRWEGINAQELLADMGGRFFVLVGNILFHTDSASSTLVGLAGNIGLFGLLLAADRIVVSNA